MPTNRSDKQIRFAVLGFNNAVGAMMKNGETEAGARSLMAMAMLRWLGEFIQTAPDPARMEQLLNDTYLAEQAAPREVAS